MDRRTVLKGITSGMAGATVAVGAVAVSSAKSAEHPDAELLALGEKLDDLRQREAASYADWAPIWEELKKRKEACWKGRTDAAGLQAYRELEKELSKGATQPRPEEVMDREAEQLQLTIMALPATTIAGLAVKARLAVFGDPGLWSASDKDANWDHLCVRKLIEAVLAMAGMKASDLLELGGTA